MCLSKLPGIYARFLLKLKQTTTPITSSVLDTNKQQNLVLFSILNTFNTGLLTRNYYHSVNQVGTPIFPQNYIVVNTFIISIIELDYNSI